MSRLSGTLVLPSGLHRGAVEFGTHFSAVDIGEAHTESAPSDDRYLLPGFIDVHVHGGGGADTMDGADGVREMARFHLRHGTTTLLPTTITSPWDQVLAALAGVAEAMRPSGGRLLPSIPGAHLEGPFINPERLGAQPPFTLEPTAERVAQVLNTDVVRVVTLAPEIAGAGAAAEMFAAAGVRVSFGHTVASATEVQSVAARIRQGGGTVGFTHLFNAMTQLKGREPGVVGAALADSEAFAELILDLHHVDVVAAQAAMAAKCGKLLLITDAVRAAGMPDGESELGGQRVTVKNGVVRLASGSLAGSSLTLDQALRNAVASGLSLSETSRLLSSVPAAYLGLNDRGSLIVGARADLVVLDAELQVRQVVVAGETLMV